jgi:glycosyltransferase involved in cell wall biosynthesis
MKWAARSRKEGRRPSFHDVGKVVDLDGRTVTAGDSEYQRPTLSVVVPTRDRPEMLTRCLESVVKAMGPEDELIVVDSASKDAEAVRRAAVGFGARVIRSDLPGAGQARNVGWKASEHEFVVFVDDDVWVDPGWADAMAERLAHDCDVGFVTGRVQAPEGQQSYFVAIKDDPEPALFGRMSRGLVGHSASLAVRRPALEAIGGFDVWFGPGARFRGADDGDLFDRLFERGYLCAYEPNALGWHDQWREKAGLVRLNLHSGIGAGGRLAKLLRTDIRRVPVVAREYWKWCVLDAWRGLRHRNKLVFAISVVRSMGILAGFFMGIAMRVDVGHYRPRSDQGSS